MARAGPNPRDVAHPKRWLLRGSPFPASNSCGQKSRTIYQSCSHQYGASSGLRTCDKSLFHDNSGVEYHETGNIEGAANEVASTIQIQCCPAMMHRVTGKYLEAFHRTRSVYWFQGGPLNLGLFAFGIWSHRLRHEMRYLQVRNLLECDFRSGWLVCCLDLVRDCLHSWSSHGWVMVIYYHLNR